MTAAPTVSASAPVLILVHGAGANGAMWNAVRRHLRPGLRVVAPDLPGHGSRSDEHFTLEAAVKVVADEVRRAAPAPVVLVGDSLGGYTSIELAGSIPPDRLAGLVLGGCSQNIDGKTLRALRIRKVVVRVMGALMGSKRLAIKSAEAMAKKGIRQDDVDAMVAGGLRLQGWGEAVDSLAGRDTLARVRQIAVPVLFINGEKDEGAVAGEAAFVAAVRDARTARFPCEHGVSLWMPAEFAGAVNGFVERLTQKAAA